ncbi:MAG: hypothetical protein HYX75_20505 [Acidobacteria bacterium]|nr:hypothetical protein [Acidobacteriota bacterium]
MKRHLSVALLAISTLALLPATSPAGDAFVKFGLVVNDLGEGFDFSDRWQIGAGADWVVADTVGIGFEVQFAYRKYTISLLGTDVDIRAIPLNLFGNVKFKPELDGGVHPFAGAGFGMMGSINSAEGGGSTEVDSDFDPGLHLMGGLELGSSDGAAFLVEFELARPVVDGAQNIYVFYGGIRF